MFPFPVGCCVVSLGQALVGSTAVALLVYTKTLIYRTPVDFTNQSTENVENLTVWRWLLGDDTLPEMF